jgi:glycosyltransferase involved in cell wall biosynthesis
MSKLGNPMRVILTMPQYPAVHYNHFTRLAQDVAVFLASHGHETWIVAHDPTSEQPEYTVEDGLHILRYTTSVTNRFDPRYWFLRKKAAVGLIKSYIGDQFDVVQGFELPAYSAALSVANPNAHAYYIMAAPVSLDILSYGLGASLLKKGSLALLSEFPHQMEQHAIKRTDTIIVGSRFMLLIAHHLYGNLVKSKIKVEHGWVDERKFQIIDGSRETQLNIQVPQHVPIFLTTTEFTPRSGLRHLIQALARLKQAGQDYHWLIEGDGTLRPLLENLSHTLGLDNNIQFLGHIPVDVLPALYELADVIVLPTTHLEGFGLSALPALACGKPVLTTPVGALLEIVERVQIQWIARDRTSAAVEKLLREYLKGDIWIPDASRIRDMLIEQGFTQQHGLQRLLSIVE